MTSVQETAALSDSLESASPKEKKENQCGEDASVNSSLPGENLQEGTLENQQEGACVGKPAGDVSKNLQEGASERGEPPCVPALKDCKEETDTAEFAAMEGELLDFEDFTTHTNENDKNGDGEAPDKKLSEKGAIDIEDGACSEGELNDDADLEEGELREPGSSLADSQPARQVCRFFHRGVCYYGSACRFLHLGANNQKGNYSMFDTSNKLHASSGFPNPQHLGAQRQPPRIPEREREFVEPEPIPPPFCNDETAWEKGLREARNLLKQAHLKRKDDPNHNEKKLNLSLCLNEKNVPPPEIELKNDTHKRGDNFSSYKSYDSYGDPPHMYNERREKDSRDNRQKRMSVERERRFPSHTHKGRNPNRAPTHNDLERPFFDTTYFDPWRRSKSPNLSRERSHSSYSSYSSYSRSSSGSRSPASSRSSRSSRSPSVQQKRKVSPVPETAVSPKVSSNRFGPVKKKPGPRTSSSRSRSPVSRNSSRSRSISMDSISNSTVSHSSSDSEHEIKDLREKSAVTNPDSATLDNKFRGIGSILNSKRDLLEEKFEDAPVEMDLRYLIPKIPEKKEPVRLALTHKNPIKLTLLNKFPQSKAGFSKDSKEFAVKKPDEPLKLNLLQGVKRPLSPSESAEPVKQTPVLLPKKSASSRRDELLKQLKAVEDAIARKRAKF